MSKPIKANIYDQATRTSMIKFIRPKDMIGTNAFRLPKQAEVYFVDPNFAINTKTKKLGIPFTYTTYYFKRNVPKPIDWPIIHGGQALIQIKTEEADTLTLEERKDNKGLSVVKLSEYIQEKEKNGTVLLAEKPIQVPAFSDWKYTDISSTELGQLLNPAFFAMIANSNKNKRADIEWYVQLGTMAGVGFIIYYLLQSMAPAIIKAMRAAGFT